MFAHYMGINIDRIDLNQHNKREIKTKIRL